MKQRRINATLTIAALALATHLFPLLLPGGPVTVALTPPSQEQLPIDSHLPIRSTYVDPLHPTPDVWALKTEGHNDHQYVSSVQMLLPCQGTWVEVDSPTSENLWAIDMLSSSEGWAVGGYCCDPWISTILHYNGVAWEVVSSPTWHQLFALDMVSQNEGWAGGQFGGLLHYSGGEWQIADSPTEIDIRDIDMVSEDEGWAVGGKMVKG